MSDEHDLEGMKEILDTTKNYERLSFLKGIAGLYYRAALDFTFGLFGLLILEGIRGNKIFYDKGLGLGPATEFSIVQVGLVVVVMGILGDISFTFTRFVSDQRYTEYLSQKDRSTIIKQFSLGSILGGVLFAVPTIILAAFQIIGEAQAWAISGLFIGGLFLLLARTTGHTPTYIFGGMISLASVIIAFEPIPGPYWMIILMVMIAASFISAMASYYYAQHQF